MIHLHNGDLVASRARNDGIPGEHVPFREALAAGPATRDLERRVEFLADSYRENGLRIRNNLLDYHRFLTEAPAAGELVLWFEHDLFCLANLIAVLYDLDGALADRARPRLSIVWEPEPLSQGDLFALFENRRELTDAMIRSGVAAWRAFSSPDPFDVQNLISANVHAFTFLREGMTLHLSRFPSAANGLGVIERRLLSLLAVSSADFSDLFAGFDPAPPRLGFGDSEVLRVLRSMASRRDPLVTIRGEDGPPRQMRFEITERGEEVLSRRNGAVVGPPIDEWLGGVHLTGESEWRWDEEQQRLVSRSAG